MLRQLVVDRWCWWPRCLSSADAQIVSNPVVTSWPPYAAANMRTYSLPAAPPVAADVCTPPVVTYYSPAATGDDRSRARHELLRPDDDVSYVRLPVAACRRSVTPLRRRLLRADHDVPGAGPHRVLCAARHDLLGVLLGPTTTYYSPLANYRMPDAAREQRLLGTDYNRAGDLLLRAGCDDAGGICAGRCGPQLWMRRPLVVPRAHDLVCRYTTSANG